MPSWSARWARASGVCWPPCPRCSGGHFERLRRAEQETPADAEASGNAPALTPGAWLDVFRKDMQSVLLAELDLRFQPVEGLLAALRTS